MSTKKRILKWLFGLFFIAAGSNHFLNPDFYVHIMPPHLPQHWALVAASGAAEIALGLLLLIPACTSMAAWGLIALLVAVFPANVHMALHPSDFLTFPPMILQLRLPLQIFLIAWAYWFTGQSEYTSRGQE